MWAIEHDTDSLFLLQQKRVYLQQIITIIIIISIIIIFIIFNVISDTAHRIRPWLPLGSCTVHLNPKPSSCCLWHSIFVHVIINNITASDFGAPSLLFPSGLQLRIPFALSLSHLSVLCTAHTILSVFIPTVMSSSIKSSYSSVLYRI